MSENFGDIFADAVQRAYISEQEGVEAAALGAARTALPWLLRRLVEHPGWLARYYRVVPWQRPEIHVYHEGLTRRYEIQEAVGVRRACANGLRRLVGRVVKR